MRLRSKEGISPKGIESTEDAKRSEADNMSNEDITQAIMIIVPLTYLLQYAIKVYYWEEEHGEVSEEDDDRS